MLRRRAAMALPARVLLRRCVRVGIVNKRFFLQLRKSLRRLDIRSRTVEVQPADRDWHQMLARLDREDRERRLRAAEAELNRLNTFS